MITIAIAILGGKEGIAEGIIKNFNSVITTIKEAFDTVNPELTETPSNYSNTVWTLIKSISNSSVLVLAGVIFAYIMITELITLITRKNNFHEVETIEIYFWVIKVGCGIFVLQNYMKILDSIFSVGTWLINQTLDLFSTTPIFDGTDLYDPTLIDQLASDKGFWDLVGMYMTSWVLSFGIKIIGLLMSVIVIGRFFDIYLYSILGSISIATLASSEYKSIGVNFIKNILALSLQGFLILASLGIYVALIKDNLTIDMSTGTTLKLTTYSIVLILSLFKTKTLAQNILQAH